MKKFLSKHKSLIYEILRFLLIGGLATIIDFIVYELCRYLIFKHTNETLNIILSTICGFFFGNVFSYIFSILFIFKGAKECKKTHTLKSFLTFTSISILGLAIKISCQTGGNYIMEYLFSINSNLENWIIDTFVYSVSTIIVLVWNYVCKKLIIFKKEKIENI